MDAGILILAAVIALVLLLWLIYLTVRVNVPGIRGPRGDRGPEGPPGPVGSVVTTASTLVTSSPASDQLLFSTLNTPAVTNFTFVRGNLVSEQLGGAGTRTTTIRLDLTYTVTGAVNNPVVFEISSAFDSILCAPSNLTTAYSVILPLGTGSASYNVYPLLTGTGLFSQTSIVSQAALTNAWAGLFIPTTGPSSTSDYRLLIMLQLPNTTTGTYNTSVVLTGSWLCV